VRTNLLREAIFALSLEHFGRPLGKISASFWVSLFPHHGRTSAEFVHAAESALSSAKVFGSNRVEAADGR
jgi:GGDEF domain-containing protein